MFVRTLAESIKFVAGDNTVLRELLNPLKDPLAIKYSLAHAVLSPGQTSTLHRLKSSEVYFILAGTGRMYIDQESRIVNVGDTIYIPPLSSQKIENIGENKLEFICIVDPAWKAEDEVLL